MSRWLIPLLMALLAGCAAQPPSPPAPGEGPAPRAPLVSLPVDAQNCLSHTECTLKTSRSLLFVFDYAEAGAPLVVSEGRLLTTPEKASSKGWPALRIQLAEPDGGRFEFHSQCRQKRCKISDARLLACYRDYLDGKACRLR